MVSQSIRELVHRRAGSRCEYCHTSELNIGQALHIEHIIPTGGDVPDNLCLACPNCNLSKGMATMAVDPETEQLVALFNPRLQVWSEHFEWEESDTQLRGKTPTGRATAVRLKMNRPRIVLARRRWVQAGLHPGETDRNE
ncbi:MAG: HNH endonuclease [Anaerolineales bacterium]|nr:HNH endonuclease [Anaerolineales bacterium]